MSGFYARFGVLPGYFDASYKLVSSPLFSPSVLALIRLSLGFYTLTTLIFDLTWESVELHDIDHWFSYFTHLTYIGMCAYFWASGVQTLFYVKTRRKGGDCYPLQRWSAFLQFLHVLLQSTVYTFPFVVTIAFWSLLSSSTTFATPFNAWSNISLHILNTVMALFEILCASAGPLPWLGLPFMVIIIILYTAMAYLTHATQGFYPYSFLDPSIHHAKVLIYIFGIMIAECIVFSLVNGVIILRSRILWRTRVEPGPPQPLDDWEKVDHPRHFS